MPVNSRWLVPGKIIYTDLIGNLTLEDLQDGSQEVIALLEESEQPKVNLIANEAQMGTLPKSLKLFSEATTFMNHPKMGWFILYPSTNTFSKFIASVISGITKVNHRHFATLEEALESLIRLDPTLPRLEEIVATLHD